MPEIERRFSQSSIFDLDHTLCTVNTSFHFGLHLVNERVLPAYKMPFLLLCYLCHKMGLMSVSLLHREACYHFFCGKSVPELKVHIDNFLNANLSKVLNEPIIGRFHEAKHQGHYTVLLSSSPDFLVSEIAKRLGFHDWAATEYILSKDQTIEEIGQLMEGETKADYVRRLQQRMSFKAEHMTAYTDSILDLAFLEAVGNPVAVNPDRKLRKLSNERGWPVI